MARPLPTVRPGPPIVDLTFPWDEPGAPDPVEALGDARAEVGDTFVVDSGRDRYLFVFSQEALREFYALAEPVTSKGLADYRMLLRKLPKELFATRRTFAHDLFGAQDVEGYLDHLDTAISRQIHELGDAGSPRSVGRWRSSCCTRMRASGSRPAAPRFSSAASSKQSDWVSARS